MPGHGMLGDRGHPVADRAETADGPVVPAIGEVVFDGDAELAGEVVDLGAAAVVGAVGGQENLGAVPRDGDGRMAGQVVGQVPQAGDEGLAVVGRGWQVT